MEPGSLKCPEGTAVEQTWLQEIEVLGIENWVLNFSDDTVKSILS